MSFYVFQLAYKVNENWSSIAQFSNIECKENKILQNASWKEFKARFIHRISAVSNAIQTKDNEANHLIIYCLNCIRHGRNETYEPGLLCLYFLFCFLLSISCYWFCFSRWLMMWPVSFWLLAGATLRNIYSNIRARSFGIFRNKNIFRNIFRPFCFWQQNSRNGNPGIPEWE